VVVMLAQLRQCVQQGRWERAIDAHFRLFTLAASHAENSGELHSLGYRIDIRSGMTGEIYPGGISKANVLASWESILKSYKALPEPHPSGLDFYFFQLARIAEAEVDPELSSRRLKLTAMEQMLLETLHRAITDTGAEELKLVRGQFVDQEFKTEDTPIHRAIFYLVRGLLTAKAEPENSNQGLLDLLRIHAEFGRRANSLSAAGLFHAARVFRSRDMLQAEKSVADELFTRYPSSNFTKQIKMNSSK